MLVALAALPAGCARSAPGAPVVDLVGLYEYADVLPQGADLPFLLARPLLPHQGWVRDETGGGAPLLWMQGTQASLQVPLASAADRELRLRARSNPAYGRRLHAQVSWNGAALARIRLAPRESEFHLSVPAALQEPGENELRFEAPQRRAGQRRVLAISSLLLVRPQDGDRASVPARSARGLSLPPGAALGYYVGNTPRPWMRLQVRAGGAGSALLAAALDDGARRVPLARFELAGGHARLVQETLPCDADAVCRLEVSNEGDGDAWLEELTLRPEPRPARASAAVPGRPNVIVFLVDALRADFLGAYGHAAPTSPRFDAFARDAILFEDTSAQSSWTRPAVATLLTGLNVESHGVGGISSVLVPEITTLAEAFRASGYGTAAFVANGVVNRQLGFDQGFEAWNGKERLESRSAADVVETALRWIDDHGSGAPFFLYVHTLDPHKPYEPAPEHHAPFLFAGYAGARDLSALIAKRRLDADELRYLRSAYQGEVHQNDAAFGAFLEGLGRRGLLERSVVAFTSDHGEEFLDHGGFGHGGTLYRELLHVPLAIRIPGAARRVLRDATPVAQIDVAPTLLALAGIAPPAEIEGRDLSARCLGLATRPEEPAPLLSRLSYAEADKLGVRMGRFKLIVNQERGRAPGARLELYDVSQDPGEQHNVAASRPFVARYLLAQAAQASAGASALRARLKAGREAPITPEHAEQLRALGYIQ